jgi:hypothetical protein
LAVAGLVGLPGLVLPQSTAVTANTPAHSQHPLRVEMRDKAQVVQDVSTLGKDEMLGRIDWDNKIIYAVGDGVLPPKDAINPAQARARAKRAAIDDSLCSPAGNSPGG